MKLNLTFQENDFKSFKTFEKAMKKQLGKDIYVGTDSVNLWFKYPKKLSAMLRPYPENKQLEFELDNNSTPR